MYGSHLLDTSLIDTLHGTNPQFEVGIDRVLHEYGHINTLERIGKSLHGEWVGSGARSHPKDVDAILQGEFHMLGSSHLGSHEHTGFLLHLLHPWQCLLAITLKATWLGTWFPHTCTEHVASLGCQVLGCCHHLLLCLGGAWSCYHKRTLVVTGQRKLF